MEGEEVADMPSGAHDMALAIKIQLPVKALSQNQTSLAHFIERAAAGDTAAFEQIMIQSQQRVMATTWRLLGNEADARDASQEVFLKVYRYLKSFKQDQDFFAWLYTITVNVCRDISKKRMAHGHVFTSLTGKAEDDELAVAAEGPSAEDALVENQNRKLIAEAMATLPERERVSIVLRDIEGFSTDEVARIMKSSSTTVRSQVSQARKKIRIYCDRYMTTKGAGVVS